MYKDIQTGELGLTLEDVRIRAPNLCIPESGPDLTEFGFTKYETTTPPATTPLQLIKEVEPLNGLQQWSVVDLLGVERDSALVQWKENICQQAERIYRHKTVSGFDFDFSTLSLKLTASDPRIEYLQGIGIKRLQTRDEEPKNDQKNWGIAKSDYTVAVMLGHGAVLDALLKTEDNTEVCLTYSEALNVLTEMSKWGKKLMRNLWRMKRDIRASSDPSSIDLNLGW